MKVRGNESESHRNVVVFKGLGKPATRRSTAGMKIAESATDGGVSQSRVLGFVLRLPARHGFSSEPSREKSDRESGAAV